MDLGELRDQGLPQQELPGLSNAHLPPEPEPRRGKWSQPARHLSPPSKPWPCDKPSQHQRAFLALRGILSLPASTPSQTCLPDAGPSQRGVAHLAWTALAEVLGPDMGKAVCWFLPAPWVQSLVVGGRGGGNEGGLITLEVLQLLSSCLLLKELPQPCATRLLVPNTSSPG